MLGKDYAGQECALASTLEVLGERWTLLIVRDAFFGVRRYSDWVARLDIPRAVLSERLRGLVANGVLARRDDPGHAGRTMYELTPAGEELWPALHALISLGRPPSPALDERLPPRGVRDRARPGGGVPGVRRRAGGRRRPRRAARDDGGPGRADPVSAAMRRPRRLLEPLEVDGPSLAPRRDHDAEAPVVPAGA